MNSILHLTAPTGPLHGTVVLPSSKSISNRLLIIRALLGGDLRIENMSDADDTLILDRLIDHPDGIDDCGAGGTTLRFLLALRCLQGFPCVITGSPRLRERPVSILVDKLRELGAEIAYTEKEGMLPIAMGKSRLTGGELTIQAGVSSQFISALLLIAPYLENGLRLKLEGAVVSKSYLDMTIALMRHCGADVWMEDVTITVLKGSYKASSFLVPADWSAAAFFYAAAALRPGSEMKLLRLANDHYQGDRELKVLMNRFGVLTLEDGDDIIIKSSGISLNNFEFNFSNTPDLAQPFAVMAALAGCHGIIHGLSTLKVKETDRLTALKQELEKAGAEIHVGLDFINVVKGINPEDAGKQVFDTYADHRMVMALSLLCLSGKTISLHEPDHVSKSYPGFFTALSETGFSMKRE